MTQKQETTTSNIIDVEDVNVETTQLPFSSTTSPVPETDIDEIHKQKPPSILISDLAPGERNSLEKVTHK